MKRRTSKSDMAHEIRRLQKTQALLIAIQHAANYDVEFEISDALAVIIALVEEVLQGFDQLEATNSD